MSQAAPSDSLRQALQRVAADGVATPGTSTNRDGLDFILDMINTSVLPRRLRFETPNGAQLNILAGERLVLGIDGYEPPFALEEVAERVQCLAQEGDVSVTWEPVEPAVHEAAKGLHAQDLAAALGLNRSHISDPFERLLSVADAAVVAIRIGGEDWQVSMPEISAVLPKATFLSEACSPKDPEASEALLILPLDDDLMLAVLDGSAAMIQAQALPHLSQFWQPSGI